MRSAPPEWVDYGPPITHPIRPSRSTSDALGERLFEQLAEDRFKLDAPDLGVALELDRVRRDARGALVGELIVYADLAGAVTFDGVLNAGDLYLTNPRARQERARLLRDRAKAPALDFESLLEELTLRVCKIERHGEPAVILPSVARPAHGDEFFRVAGLHLAKRHAAIAFGDGATAKSLIALHIAGLLQAQGVPILYCDWEMSEVDHRVRLERLFGTAMPPVRYVRCVRPLVHEADRIRRIVREDGIAYVVLDSVAVACNGRPEDAEIATGYARAFRSLGIGGLHLAHVSKAEGADLKPFGSVFWHNLARQTWNTKLEATSADCTRLTVAWFPRKSNVGAPGGPPTGFEVSFEADSQIQIAATDVSNVDALAVHLPLKDRIRQLLGGEGAKTYAEIAAALDIPEDSARKAITRASTMFTTIPGVTPTRIALVTRRSA